MKISKFLTKEEILKKITPYDIYRYYFGEFEPNRKYLNHLRGDRSQPSFEIRNTSNGLYHIDYASSYWKGDCFSLVKQIYNCTFTKALNIVAMDFGLSNFEKPSPINWKVPEIKEKKYALIQVVPKSFTKDELSYWNDYGQSKDDLKDLVYSPKEVYVNRQKINIKNELVFAYKFGDNWKIYSPFNKDRKWITNCPLNTMYGLENLENSKCGLIVKSVKDYLVCKKFIMNEVAGVQNESTVSISEENIKYILSNCENPYIVFDNDKAGVEACTHYNSLGFNYWNIPKRYNKNRGIKDPSDLYYWYGKERLVKEINKKIKC